MSSRADNQLAGSADQLMRRTLHELDGLRAYAARDAKQIQELRESVRAALTQAERESRTHVDSFKPTDLGEELRRDLTRAWPPERLPKRRAPEVPPESFEAAKDEWGKLTLYLEEDIRQLVRAKQEWDAKTFKRKRSMPLVSDELWAATERLSEIHAALPTLRERFVVDRLASMAHLNDELDTEVQRRRAALARACDETRTNLNDIEMSTELAAASWAHPGWLDVSPSPTLQRVIRLGEFEPGLPQASNIDPVPALLEFPLRSGIAIATDVDQRRSAIDLARSIVLRCLAATPPGDVRFVFMDPVSLGHSVAEFRHLSEFDQRLVDIKTWTSERDIETKLAELSDHLEVVISTYLRGQFDSIDEYNRQAGEVAEPYRILVVFDYPHGFTGASTRQLLSLIENGPRCGVQTVLVHDPSHGPREEIPAERLTHSMHRIALTEAGRRVTMAEPVGAVDLDFLPDATPPITFAADAKATTPFAQMLLDIGAASRRTLSGPVTLDRVMPILSKLISSERSDQVPHVGDPGRAIDIANPDTWWAATTAPSACAPIGRSGASDLATLYFSSTEIAGGAIVVGLPRSGKSTALHAAILSLSIIYSPTELELYLVDSKHGVEFKVYENLPHARLVSINSEREFSVSVLQNLDGEIKRRAELMKQRTAGKANITEYRAATGEVLPRVVLLMDEFHELFEEDDALGQDAFQAFSNIVRQGPFAGVHVVVASQTLSSMPAMDRSTLSLLPMRVAFMCNEADADLVMGDTNREVKSLSQQGEGILNPARGEPSHNKPFRGVYIAPDQRADLLTRISAKAQHTGFARAPRVFDGDTLAPRPGEQVESSAVRPFIAMGEPFTLKSSAGIALRRGRAANVLLLGAGLDDETQDPSVDGAVHSCLADGSAQGLTVSVVDFLGAPGSYGALDLVTASSVVGATYRRASGLAEVLEALASEIAARRQASDYNRPGFLLVLNGVQRALDLLPEDPYAPIDEDAAGHKRTAQLIASALREGPELGCHVVVVVDQLGQFERRLGRDLLKEFDWRIAGSGVGPADIATMTESHSEPQVRHSQLLLVDHGKGKSQRVRAYPGHTSESIQAAMDQTNRTPT